MPLTIHWLVGGRSSHLQCLNFKAWATSIWSRVPKSNQDECQREIFSPFPTTLPSSLLQFLTSVHTSIHKNKRLHVAPPRSYRIVLYSKYQIVIFCHRLGPSHMPDNQSFFHQQTNSHLTINAPILQTSRKYVSIMSAFSARLLKMRETNDRGQIR